MNDERKIVNIPIEEIVPNIYQPRIIFDNKSLEDLSNSIKKYGIIQPLVLRKLSNKYEIIDGERRYKAAKKIGFKNVPAIVLNIEDKEIAELILNENIQKQLLNPIEEANAYEQIMLLNKCNLEELSKKTGKDIKHIENKLNLLNLPPEVQEGLLNKKISESHARLLTKIEKKKDKIDLYNRIIKERLTIKEVENIINSLKTPNYNSIKREKKVIDKFSLEELNENDFITKQKRIKMEDENMNNQNMNFNQYNGLLKEQEKPQMENNGIPEPILQGNIPNTKSTDFFPSLEEQPLNTDVPTNVNGVMPMTPPPVDMSTPAPMDMPTLDVNQTPTFNNNQNIQANNITDIQMPEIPNQNNNSVMNNIPNEIQNTSDNQTQNVKMPTFNFEGQYQQKNSPPNILTPDFNIINSTPPMPEFNQINSAQMDNTIPTPEALNTPFEMPTMNSTPEVNTNIPQINNQNIQNDNMPTPNFNVIDSANTQPTLEVTNQSFEVPTMNNGLDIQNSNPIQMPEFNVPNNTLEENNTPTLEVLNQPFEMPTLNSNNIEPTLNNGMDMQNNMPNMQPNNEIPVFNSINNNENNVQGKDLTSAIAILKDVLPLLNHAGFNVTLDETDTNNEHLVTFKIQK